MGRRGPSVALSSGACPYRGFSLTLLMIRHFCTEQEGDKEARTERTHVLDAEQHWWERMTPLALWHVGGIPAPKIYCGTCVEHGFYLGVLSM